MGNKGELVMNAGLAANFSARSYRVAALIMLLLMAAFLPGVARAANGQCGGKPCAVQKNGPAPVTLPVTQVYGYAPIDWSMEYNRDYVFNTPALQSARGFVGGLYTYNNPKTPSANKQKNKGKCQSAASDPVIISDGAKVLDIPLFTVPGEMGLKYVLYYHSVTSSSFWAYNPWTSSLSYVLDLYCGVTSPGYPCSEVTLYRPDGSSVSFSGNQASYGNFPEIGGGGLATLVHNSNGTWTLHDEDSTIQTYSQYGYLSSIKDVSGIGWTITSTVSTSGAALPASGTAIANGCPSPEGILHPMCAPTNPPPQNTSTTTTTVITHTNGQSITVVAVVKNAGTTYASGSVSITDPAGNQYTYALAYYPVGSGLDAAHVTSLTFPGSPATTMSFSYTGSNQLLSGVAYNGTAYWSTSYNSSNQVSSDGAADGTERTSIVYSPSSGGMVATITNPLGLTTTNTYTTDSQGNYLLSKVSNSAVQGCGATTNSLAWDANDNLTKTVDSDGITHTYHYAANGQLQTETEAYGSATARTTNYTWDPDAQLNRLLSATIPGESKVSYTYNS